MNLVKHIFLFFFMFSVSLGFAKAAPNNVVLTEIDSTSWTFNDNVHLVAEVSKKTIDLGASVTVTYKMYVSYSFGISNWEEIEASKYENFECKTIDLNQLTVDYATYKGKKYRCVIYKKVILSPKQKGRLEIESKKLKISAEIPSNKKDIFEGKLMKTITKILETNSIVITVK